MHPFGTRAASTLGGGGATTGNANRSMYDSVTGTPTNGAHPDALANHYGMHINAVSTFESVTVNSSPTRVRFGFHVWIVTNAATAAWQLASALTAGATRHHIRQNSAAGNNIESLAAGGTAAVQVASPTAGIMYWIEVLVDVSTGTHTVDTWVNGVKGPQSSVALAASTIASVAAGNVNATGTGDFWVSDLVVSDTPDDPIGETYVLGFSPTGCGTHVMTTGDFTDDAAANVVVGETTSYLKIDEWPANTTDYVRQAVIRSTGYLEYTFTPTPPVGYPEPKCVRIDSAMFPVASATATDTWGMLLNDTVGNVVSAEALYDVTLTAGTLEYHAHFYPRRVGTLGPWDLRSLQGARVQNGLSTDVTPVPALSALLMTAAFGKASLPGGTPMERSRRTRKLRR